MKKLVIIIATLLTVLGNGMAQNRYGINVKGFVDTYHGVRIKKPNDFLISRSRFRGEVDKISGNSYFFASVNAVYNNLTPEKSQIQFREAFFEYTSKNWGLKAGRQIIIWGKADGLKITDVISPMDLSEFLAQDYDDIRMPVNGIVLSRFGQNWNVDLVCIPAFESYILPDKDSPWGFDYSKSNLIMDDAVNPQMKLGNMEYGGKLSFFSRGIDVEISGLRTWNKMPVYSYYVDSTSTVHIKPEYHRLGFVGLSVSKSLNAFVLRGESAFYFDKKFSPKIENLNLGLWESNSINYLIGIDLYPGYEWTFTAQFSDEYILDFIEKIQQEQHTLISTLGISKRLINSTLAVSTFAYVGLNQGDFFNRSSIDYSLSDNIHLIAGIDWFEGDSGTFGRYNDNSQIWVKAKFSF